MKMKVLALLACAIISANAFADGNDIIYQQRNAADTGNLQRIPNTPTDGSNAIFYFNGSTLLPGYLSLGSNLNINSGVINAASQVNSDWNATTGVSKINNKPTISTVGMTGQYGDLIGAPSFTQTNSDWNATSGAAQILNKPSLATVATTGNYTDLTNKPTIPAAQVNADWNAASGVAQILNKPTIISAMTVGSPNSRTLSLATAYQSTDTTKPAIVTVNLNSTAALSLTGGTTVVGEVRIGPTNGVATGSGTAVGAYKNSLTGTLTVGLNIQTDSYNTVTFALPAGWYFAVRQTTGTGLAVVSAFDQSIGN